MGNCACKPQNDKTNQKVLYVDMYEPPKYDVSLPKIKLLFLDVDGVLCSSMYGTKKEYFKHLKQIIEETKCKIVISSTWRLNPRHRSQLLGLISRYCEYTTEQVNQLVIGDTPDLIYTDDPMKSHAMEIKYCRAHEIDSFLRSQKIKIEYNVISWVALDDDTLDSPQLNYYASEIMKDHFVHIDPMYCLNKSYAEKAISILNS